MEIVEVLKAENLMVLFRDGENALRVMNIAPYIRGSWYGKLADKEYFKLAGVVDDGMVIGWPDGQAISPDDLEELSMVVVPARVTA